MKTMFTLQCKLTGEIQTVIVCDKHSKEMPLVNNENVKAELADKDCNCEFCPKS